MRSVPSSHPDPILFAPLGRAGEDDSRPTWRILRRDGIAATDEKAPVGAIGADRVDRHAPRMSLTGDREVVVRVEDPVSVGREAWAGVDVPVVREPLLVGAVGVHREHLIEAEGNRTDVGNPTTVGGPG